MADLSHESAALPARRQTPSSARLSRDGAAEAGLIALLLLAPLPLGSVHPGAVLVVTAWIAVLSWLVLPWGAAGPAASAEAPAAVLGGAHLEASAAHRAAGPTTRTRRTWTGSRAWGWVCAGLLVVAAAQVLPLPAGLVRALSPAAARLRETLPLGPAPSWMTLSVHSEATGSALALLGAVLAAFLVAAKLGSREGAARRILAAIFGAGLFQAVYGSAEYLSGHQHIFATPKRFYTDSATGTYVNQNHFAGALEMALLVGLGFVLCQASGGGAGRGGDGPAGWRARLIAAFDERRAVAAAWMVALAVTGLGLVFSYSRAGIAAASIAGAGVLIVHAMRARDRRWIAPAVVLDGGLLALVTLAGWDRTLADLERQLQPITLNQSRVRVWRDCLRIVADYPIFGTGLGTFADIYPAYRHENIQLIYDAAHNDYLQLAVEAGAVGVLAGLVALGLYLIVLRRALARASRRDAPLWLGAAGGVAALLLHELVDFNLHSPANALLFAVLSGALLGGAAAGSGAAEESDGRRVLAFKPRRRGSRPLPRAARETGSAGSGGPSIESECMPMRPWGIGALRDIPAR